MSRLNSWLAVKADVHTTQCPKRWLVEPTLQARGAILASVQVFYHPTPSSVYHAKTAPKHKHTHLLKEHRVLLGVAADKRRND